MATRGWTIKLEFMVENDLNQSDTRELFQQLIGQRRYTRDNPRGTADESTPLRDVLKQYGLLSLEECGAYAHLGDAYHNKEVWDGIVERRNKTPAPQAMEAVDAS